MRTALSLSLLLWVTNASAEVPDAGAPDAAPRYVQIRADGPQAYLQRVYFDPGSTVINKAGKLYLDEVARTMAARPEITLVEVQGSTDTKEDADQRLRLSQQRADAVRSFLTQRGVAPQRLVSRGYGDSRPAGDNKTSDGRAQNRYVGFKALNAPGLSR